MLIRKISVAYDIAKIYIWKQITTLWLISQHQHNVAYDIAKIYIWKQITTKVDVDTQNKCCL